METNSADIAKEFALQALRFMGLTPSASWIRNIVTPTIPVPDNCKRNVEVWIDGNRNKQCFLYLILAEPSWRVVECNFCVFIDQKEYQGEFGVKDGRPFSVRGFFPFVPGWTEERLAQRRELVAATELTYRLARLGLDCITPDQTKEQYDMFKLATWL